ncbi:MAG: hypothetical protein IKA66_04570, partial [Candidatus Methanomethylophilaceae archaeon]|nr:hypothetical protein [Candidatus Methanomethylophilaceae archaeon]
HSVTKPILFFSAGNIIQSYGTRDMSRIRGVSRTLPTTSALMTIGTLAIIGSPPFAVFIGEFTLLKGSLEAGMVWLTVAMVVLLCIVFAGFTRNVFPMITGEPVDEVETHPSPSRHIPLVVLAVASLLIGLFMPEQVVGWFGNAADSLMGVFL